MNQDEKEPVMYIVFNSDLKMDWGKKIVQAVHSACKIVINLEHMFHESILWQETELYENYEEGKLAQKPSAEALKWYAEWQQGSYVKILVKAPELVLRDLIQRYHPYQEGRNIWLEYTIDEGRTDIPAGSLTTVVFNPAPKSELPKELSDKNKIKLV